MFDSLKQLALTAITHLHTRVELFELELEEEKSRLITIGISLALAFFFAAMTMVAVVVSVVGYFWDTVYRAVVLGSLIGAFALAMVVALAVLRAQLKTRSTLFKSSLAELRKDRDVLEQLNDAA